jgi:HAD superfamily hydrolase (TIGR01509 family)
MIRAVIFDFDGLIVDTEEPIFRVWQRIYQEHGHELPLEQWLKIIGGNSAAFDPRRDLGQRTGEEINKRDLDALERLYYREATAMQDLLPGVRRYLDDARRLGLKTAIASSSGRQWIDEHLERMGIAKLFDAIICRDDVTAIKPDPELYLTAVGRLEVQVREAIALEDSTNGIRAAKAAGLFCIAVPNAMTVSMNLSQADLQLSSLDEMPLEELVKTIRR